MMGPRDPNHVNAHEEMKGDFSSLVKAEAVMDDTSPKKSSIGVKLKMGFGRPKRNNKTRASKSKGEFSDESSDLEDGKGGSSSSDDDDLDDDEDSSDDDDRSPYNNRPMGKFKSPQKKGVKDFARESESKNPLKAHTEMTAAKKE
jgi:hypothetical protein